MAAVLLSSVGAFAQHEVGSFSIQPKAGMTVSSVTGMGEQIDAKSKIGFTAGADAEYQATDWLGISAGVNYSLQGAKANYSYSLGNVANATLDGDLKLGYVNVPVVANVYVTKGLALKAGVQFGFLTSSKMTLDGSISALGIGAGGSTDVDLKDYTNSTAISIPMGISYEYNNFVVDARYNLGLTKLGKENEDISKVTGLAGIKYDETKNNVFQITLGYKFDL